jgi:hypothetical protein
MAEQGSGSERHTGRKWGVGILVFLGVILLVFANVAFWAYFTLINTNGWVASVGSLSKDPAVAELVSQYVVNDLFEQAEVDTMMKEALPQELQIFSGPLAIGLQEVSGQVVTKLIMSDAFNTVWASVNRVSHTAVMEVLQGNGDRLYFQDGNLTLDFSDLYNFVQDRLGIANLNLIPQVENGRLVLLQNRQVAVLQEVVSYLTILGLLLPLITIVLLGVAVWMSLWRRTTVIWIGVGITIVMFISLILFSGVRSSTLIAIEDPFARDLGRAILNALTHGLMVQTLFFMLIGILLIIGGWQAAPNSALRQWEASRKTKQLADVGQEPAAS